MRKDAVEARGTIEALGFVEDHRDAEGHIVFRHPANGATVSLAMSPSDRNGPRRAITEARKAVGERPLAAARKRRPAADRRAEQAARRRREQAARDAIKSGNIDAAQRVRDRVEHDADADQLAARIRQLTTELRACTTPADRATVEARLRPLVQQHAALRSWTPLPLGFPHAA